MLQESVPRSIYLQLLGQPEARSDDNSLRAVGCAKSWSCPVVESLRKPKAETVLPVSLPVDGRLVAGGRCKEEALLAQVQW